MPVVSVHAWRREVAPLLGSMEFVSRFGSHMEPCGPASPGLELPKKSDDPNIRI
jgi:hypothetical protein